MSRFCSFRGWLAAACFALAGGAAAAQADTGPPSVAPVAANDRIALGLEIRAAPAELDSGAVRDLIATELDVAVTEITPQWPPLGVVIVAIDHNAARVVYRRTSGASIERTLSLPLVPAERVQLIAFIATNLVRDQASEILATMSRRAVGPTAQIEAPAPAPVEPVPPSQHMLASAGFVPPLQIDRLYGRHVIVGAGLYVVMGMQDGSEVLSLSGVVDYQRRFATGVQIAGAVTITSQLDGVQLAGAASLANHAQGVQIAGATSVASRVTGLQLAGAVNVADEVRGVQIAPVNIAHKLHGLQLGVVNISDGDDDAVPIGIINIARHGRTEFETTVDSSELSTLTLRHGPRHVQNVVGIGWAPSHDGLLFGAGLGFHQGFPSAAVPFSLDVDAMAWTPAAWNTEDLGLLNQLRTTIAVPVGPIDVIGGVSGNVYVNDGKGFLSDLHPHLDHTYTSGTTTVTLWPSGFVGLRLRT
jgi:hypothetical protein